MVGGVLLTAGISETAAQLSVWPWVGLPEGNLRTTVPIPVDWESEAGVRESCRAYLELSDATPEHIERLDAAIRAEEWTGFGQRLYDQGVPDSGGDESRVSEQLGGALIEFAKQALPDLTAFTDADFDPSASGPRVDALGMSCRPDDPA